MTESSFSLLALGALPFLVGCHVEEAAAKRLPDEGKPAAVATDTATPRSVATTVPLTGTLRANRESALAADTSGRVIAVNVERGSRVKKGDVVARIDRRDAALAIAEAETGIASARTRSALAKLDCERAERLYAGRAIAEAEYQATRTRCEEATQLVEAARVRKQQANKAFGDGTIRAPFDAIVAERFVNPGEHVGPDSRVAALVELDTLRLELSVPEHALEASKPGSEVRFRVAAFRDETFSARVKFVGASVRPTTRDLLVEAEVDNAELKLRPGMFASAEVSIGSVTLPAVPAAAIRSDAAQSTDRIFVVANGVIEERLVQLGPSSDGWVAIRAGLRSGERFVLAPAASIADGQRVR